MGRLTYPLLIAVKSILAIDTKHKYIDFLNGFILKKLTAKNIDFLKFDTKEKYDIIICVEVFEHIPPDKKSMFLLKMKSMLNKDGIILFTTNNRYWIMEGHYDLPFIGWLPYSWQKSYAKLFNKVRLDGSIVYGEGYYSLKKWFRRTGLKFKFVPPAKPKSLMHKIGSKLIRLSSLFWNISPGFIAILEAEDV